MHSGSTVIRPMMNCTQLTHNQRLKTDVENATPFGSLSSPRLSRIALLTTRMAKGKYGSKADHSAVWPHILCVGYCSYFAICGFSFCHGLVGSVGCWLARAVGYPQGSRLITGLTDGIYPAAKRDRLSIMVRACGSLIAAYCQLLA
jgi:hypothetical protein